MEQNPSGEAMVTQLVNSLHFMETNDHYSAPNSLPVDLNLC
jgi:hypothetical protein